MRILDRLPFAAEPTVVNPPAGLPVEIRAYQIVVWLSFRIRGSLTHPFPAVLDTGHSHNLSINEATLAMWLNLQPSQFPARALTRLDGQKLALRTARLVLHANISKTKTLARSHHELTIPQGIVIHPKQMNFPRLPLLGLRALVNSGLRVAIDGQKRLVSVGTGWRGARWG